MKSKIKIFILVLSVYLPLSSAKAVASTETARLEPALSWQQARGLCRDLGGNWDLPTVSEITTHSVSIEKFAKVLHKDLKSQKLSHYNLIWVRSDEEALNQQLVKSSQALKYDNLTGIYDAYILTTNYSAQRSRYVNALRENKVALARTTAEQNTLMAYLKDYKATGFAELYPIDEDYPISMQEGYVRMLPPQVLPNEILAILEKPSLRFVETEIENIQYELDVTSNGLEVICLKQDF